MSPVPVFRQIDVAVVMQATISVDGRARIARDGKSVAPECLRTALNPVDLVALEEALKLRESGLVSTVTCLAVGPGADVALAHGLAMGADRIVRAEAPTELYVDARLLGRSIAAALADSVAQLIFVAGQSVDGDAEVLPHEIAVALDAACLTRATALKLSRDEVEVERWLEKGRREIWAAGLPAVVAFDTRANNPRYVAVAALALAHRSALSESVVHHADVRAVQSGAATSLQRFVTPRVRVKRVAGGSSEQGVSDRMRAAVSGGSVESNSGKALSGPPEHVADQIVAFLGERGLLAPDGK